jgi:3-oxoadipate enol-lactonase
VAAVETSLGPIGAAQQGSADNAGGTPVVFLHGVGSDKRVWAPQLAHFGKTRRAVAFDYPGYGDSAPAAQGTSRDDFAAAILAAMDSLDIAEAHICGLSLGGVVAIAIHSAAPQRCRSLILADAFAVHPDGRAIYERSVAASTDLRALAQARVEVLLAPGASDDIRTEVVETMARIDSAAYRIGAQAVWLADQRENASAIRVPTLVLVGEEDRVTPPRLSKELAEMIPGARLERIAGAGHLSNLERPRIFNARVDEFLTQVERN